MEVRIERLARMRVAYLRHVGPYRDCWPTLERMLQWAGERGLLGPATRVLGICHDNPEEVPAERLRYDAAVTVGPMFETAGDVGVQEVGGGEYAHARHVGSYTKLSATYAHVARKWVPKRRRAVAPAPFLEFYLDDPRATPEAQLRTDIYVPLRPAPRS